MDIAEKTLFVDEVLGVRLMCEVSSRKLSTKGSKIKVFTLGGNQTLNVLPRF